MNPMYPHFHPEIYHKKFYHRHYFEGWYYKQVTADQQHSISFIPGVSYTQKETHGFIQCIHCLPNDQIRTYRINYPIADFSASTNPFQVKLHQSIFSLEKMELAVNSESFSASGRLRFDALTPIKRSVLCPNIMGITSYLPFMECNHGVISMNHSLTGQLKINGQTLDFNGGKGYIEKDWGRSFPSQYAWLHSNHFTNPTVSLFFSVATIPYLGHSFQGYICNLLVDGKEYRFASYNRSRLALYQLTEQSIRLKLISPNYQLTIIGQSPSAQSLAAPKNGQMNKTIKEGLAATIQIQLTDRRNRPILTDISHTGGMEVVPALG